VCYIDFELCARIWGRIFRDSSHENGEHKYGQENEIFYAIRLYGTREMAIWILVAKKSGCLSVQSSFPFIKGMRFSNKEIQLPYFFVKSEIRVLCKLVNTFSIKVNLSSSILYKKWKLIIKV